MLYTKLQELHFRRRFDPSKSEDITELAFFMKNNKWKNICPFYLEFPWDNIPAMCKDKYSNYMLKSLSG